MDKSVEAGRRFLQLRQRRLDQERPKSRRTASSIGGFHIADQEREQNTRELFDEHPQVQCRGRAATKRGSPIITSAYLDTDAIDTRRHGPGQGRPRRDRRDRRQARAERARSAARCAPTPIRLNATNFQTDNLFGIFVTQGLSTPGENAALSDAGRPRHARARILPVGRRRDGRTCATSIAPMSQTVMKAAGNRRSAGRRRPDHRRSKPRSPRPTRPREESEDFAKGAKVWTRAELEQNAPGIDWSALLDAAQLGRRPEVRGLSRRRDPEARRAGRLGAARRMEGLAGVPHAQPAGERPAQADPRRQLRLLRHRAVAARPSSAPRDKLALNATSNALQDAVGKAYVDKYFPASAKAEIQGMVDNIKAAFAKRVAGDRLDGAVDQGRSAEEGRDDRRRRRLSRQLARLFGADDQPDRRLRQPEGARASPNTGTSSPRSASRWTAPNGGCRRSWSTRSICRCRTRSISRRRSSQPPFFDPKADAGVQLWRDRRGDRPRDQPQLRQ